MFRSIINSCAITRLKGFTLIEIVVTIALLTLVFFGITSVFRTALVLTSESKIKIIANSIGVEQIERIRSLDYNSVGTYLPSENCETYDPNNNQCVVGVPSGPIPQTLEERLNNVNYVIDNTIVYRDDPSDGVGENDANNVDTDYKAVRTTISWSGRDGEMNNLVFTTIIAPPGVETSVGGGTARIVVYDSNVEPVSNKQITIVNNSLSPAISQQSTTDINGHSLFSGLPAGSGYEVYVNIDSSGNIADATHSYDQTYLIEQTDDNGDGYINANPVLTPITIEESNTTTLTMLVEPNATVEFLADQTGFESTFQDEFVNSDNLVNLNNAQLINEQIRLSADAETGAYVSSGSVETAELPANIDVQGWGSLILDGNVPVGSSATIQIYSLDEQNNLVLIPDEIISGNSNGYDLNASVDLTSIDHTVHPKIIIKVNLSTSDYNVSPEIERLVIDYIRSGGALEEVSLNLLSDKSIGTTSSGEVIPKLRIDGLTDSTGSAVLNELETGRYSANISGPNEYSLISVCPHINNAIKLESNSSQTISSTWQENNSTNNVLIVTIVDSEGEEVENINTTINHDGITRNMVTDECGAMVVSDVTGASATIDFNYDGVDYVETIDILGGIQEITIMTN